MKNFLSTFLVCLLSLNCLGQLEVDAGNDTTFCVGIYQDTIHLGNGLSIVNGTEPYSITWKCEKQIGGRIYTARHFLNDTTIAKPFFIDIVPSGFGELIFFVSVTDKENNIATDSIIAGFSHCVCNTGTIVKEINKGDSIWLDAGEEYGYHKFFWEPKDGLTNPDSSATWCKPEITTSYSFVMIDTFGCTCKCPVYEVRIHTTGVNKFKPKNRKSLRIRQDGRFIYFNNFLNQEVNITIVSINGKIENKIKIAQDYLEIDKLIKNKGIYIIRITLGKITDEIKIIKS